MITWWNLQPNFPLYWNIICFTIRKQFMEIPKYMYSLTFLGQSFASGKEFAYLCAKTIHWPYTYTLCMYMFVNGNILKTLVHWSAVTRGPWCILLYNVKKCKSEETNISNKCNIVKNPNWQRADQLAITKGDWGFELWTTEKQIPLVAECKPWTQDLQITMPVPYTTRLRCLLVSISQASAWTAPLNPVSCALTMKPPPSPFFCHRRNWINIFCNIRINSRFTEASCTCVTFLPISFKL